MLWTEYLLNMNWSEPFKIKFSLKSLFYNAFQAHLGYSSNTFYIFSPDPHGHFEFRGTLLNIGFLISDLDTLQ